MSENKDNWKTQPDDLKHYSTHGADGSESSGRVLKNAPIATNPSPKPLKKFWSRGMIASVVVIVLLVGTAIALTTTLNVTQIINTTAAGFTVSVTSDATPPVTCPTGTLIVTCSSVTLSAGQKEHLTAIVTFTTSTNVNATSSSTNTAITITPTGLTTLTTASPSITYTITNISVASTSGTITITFTGN